MKKIPFIILLIFCSFNLNAQFGPQQIISADLDGARSVFCSDIDGDGDLDVLTASSFGNKVSWFEKIDGQGSFGEANNLDTNLPNCASVFAIDLDGDGDNDVISGRSGTGTGNIVWYQNLDGLGNFSNRRIVSSNLAGTIKVLGADLDNDGDNDLISSSSQDNKIAWYQNDGIGNFGIQLIITTNALSTRDVIADDIDNDGDMDLVYTDTDGDRVLWQENTDGLGNFGPQRTVSPNANGVLSVFAADIDGDNDLDIFSAVNGDNRIDWSENTDGLGNFGQPQEIVSHPDNERFVFGSDLDNDGDIDLISGYQSDNIIGELFWFENLDGLGNFGAYQVISTNVEALRDIFACDIDNDGDMDVVSASLAGDNVAWFENLTILDITENRASNILIYPNPTDEFLTINTLENTIKKIAIFDVIGKRMQTTTDIDSDDISINVKNLSAGIYMLLLEDSLGVQIIKKFVKK